MIADLKPYPVYKNSGVPWLGEVPEKWDILPALAVYKPKQAKNTGMLEKTVLSLSYGHIIVKPPEKLRGLVPESFETYQIVDPGNIIVRTTDLQNDHTSLRIGHSKNRGIITSAYMCLESTDRVSNEFGYQFLNTYDLLKIIYGFGSGLRQNLDFADIRRMPVLVPPKEEQSAIVRFLDHADRRIKRYIHTKQKLIKLLKEQKQTIIHRAVTRGLNPNVRLKPSGVQWLGDVPEHWEVAALRHRYAQCLGKMLDSKRITGSNSLPYLRNTDVQWDRVNIKDLPMMDISPTEYSRYTIQPGDLLVCEGGEVGRCALWSGELAVCGFQKALHRLRPSNPGQEIPRFMYYALRAAAKGNAFNDGHLSTIAHLTGDKLQAHRFPFPPLEEQQSLVRFLDAELKRIDRAVSTAWCEIELLREYRTRLIADVVTGKFDVREAAAKLPDESDNSDSVDDADYVEGEEGTEDPDIAVDPEEAEV
jgi:type I restriction enzyme S subunit